MPVEESLLTQRWCRAELDAHDPSLARLPDAKLPGVKGIAVLGSTGSIGAQTLDIVRRLPDRFRVVGLAAHSNAEVLSAQQAEFGCAVALYDQAAASSFGIPGGIEAICDLVRRPDVDIVVVSVAGVVGLLPTLAAIESGKWIALASKEVLVAAGEIVMPMARSVGVPIVPIDSEHSAIFQCLQGAPSGSVEALILTASGGPFRGWDLGRLAGVGVEDARRHPTWSMGGKITIDSATLMNKGLETIEARWLFEVPIDQVRVVVHPQSIVHSFVEFRDGSVLAQLGFPDMRLPIQYALLYPERVSAGLPAWSPLDACALTFEPVDDGVFRCLALARESARIGGTMPCAMNAANEEAVGAFLRGQIGFLGIAKTVEDVMEKHNALTVDLPTILEVDRWARETACEAMGVH